ncbi:hypothetical protein RV134_210093 [Roseovarius sp. EC-HK134]|nr:hypothetical protein RV134_210093 [Roseovarius sp. EC-HK134]VVT00964.1 hypothetical protein RV420_250043 [Roseovarius sp. EC-SD190]
MGKCGARFQSEAARRCSKQDTAPRDSRIFYKLHSTTLKLNFSGSYNLHPLEVQPI